MAVDPSADEIEVVLDPIHHLPAVETEWHRLESLAKPSFFTSRAWIGTYLEVIPPSSVLRCSAWQVGAPQSLCCCSAGAQVDDTGSSCHAAST